MLKVYLAAPYSQKDYIKKCAGSLCDTGVHITSSWLNETFAPTVQMAEVPVETLREYAIRDVKDVRDAQILVFFNEPTKTVIRAGRHVEFGIAIGIGLTRKIPIFVVGAEYENIFHHLPQVTHFENWEKVRDLLIAMA
jgi:hypothetical protein